MPLTHAQEAWYNAEIARLEAWRDQVRQSLLDIATENDTFIRWGDAYSIQRPRIATLESQEQRLTMRINELVYRRETGGRSFLFNLKVKETPVDGS